MRQLHRALLLLMTASAVLFSVPAHGQDEQPPSLGDVARQSRLQKQKAAPQSKDSAPDAPSKDARTNDGQAKPAQGNDVAAKDLRSKDSSTQGGSGKGVQPKTAKKVITNDEIPQHIGPTRTQPASAARTEEEDSPEPDEGNGKPPADYWRARILSEKNAIAALKNDIDSLNASIQYAGGNCVSGCVQWNERQQQKQQQVEAMKAQLDQQQAQLEDMQEMARKQGYGSSIYDP
jgi:hypothetical protein